MKIKRFRLLSLDFVYLRATVVTGEYRKRNADQQKHQGHDAIDQCKYGVEASFNCFRARRSDTLPAVLRCRQVLYGRR